MPHLRTRHLSSLLKSLCSFSPLVGILGHRQVGKTTLLETFCHKYFTFDDLDTMQNATKNPKAFLATVSAPLSAIDECQLVESLFPALKERVRKNKKPGQILLSGSVRFTSKKLIRESLTGRIITADLIPLTLSELAQCELPNWIQELVNCKQITSVKFLKLSRAQFLKRKKTIDLYLTNGGLPGVCFIRDNKLRAQKLTSQLETILNRDLRQIYETTLPIVDILSFLRSLAKKDGDDIQYQQVKRETGISPITQKKLLFAMEATFIVRIIPLEGDYHGHAIYFEDQAEAEMLSQGKLTPLQRWSGLIYRNLREQILYRIGENADFFQYRTRGGAFVPIAIRQPQSVLGFVPIEGDVTRKSMASAHSFLRKYADSKVIFVTKENIYRCIDDRTLIVPAASLLYP